MTDLRILAALVLVAVSLAATGGCSSSGVQVDAVTHSMAFKEAFRAPVLAKESTARCGILPALAPSQPGLAPLASMSLLRSLQQEVPGHAVLPAAIVASRLNAAGLADLWHETVVNYSAGGILDRDRLRKIADAADVRYLFMPVLATVATYSNNRFTLLGLVVNWTVSTTVDVSLQAWDAETGDLVWASTGMCTIEAEVVLNSRASLNRALETAFAAMIEDLVKGRSSSVWRRLVPAAEVQAEQADSNAETARNPDGPTDVSPPPTAEPSETNRGS